MTVLPYGRGVGKVGKGKNPTSAPSAVDGPPPSLYSALAQACCASRYRG